ncbi:tRNA pseudouridine(55) synthase TruB [Paenalkalicoccus suaedae]|uniref:tRNA pseudouridine synthase B n=1 Tax=Paenalkalicoccus suaedae TaxID=2592382 RepID=A0A859FFB8_9BACI|nr:tRNA pseudouridine(55) synthase TruB [Paenalkalicoccus suaedae]QKS71392.1 tRNA pseudouridine(55) synthase TruB [Paenalkalicoccus suaedae]
MSEELIGVLPLWKPRGITSFDAVQRARRFYKTKKAGHTGTLDPDVEGVLPICIGKATKIVEYLTADKKVYAGEVTLGFSTTTEDASGEVVDQKRVDREITEEEVDRVLASFEGELSQVPPMYSAIKVNGKKLYEYARAGLSVERPVRQITIYSLTRTSDIRQEDGKLTFSYEVECSKGTYVRTLSVQIGEKLGYPAHMSDLVRLESGAFKKEDCFTLEQIEAKAEIGQERSLLLSVEHALSRFPVITVSPELEEKVRNGAIIDTPEEVNKLAGDFIALYNQNQECLALYKHDPKRAGMMKPEKMIRGLV